MINIKKSFLNYITYILFMIKILIWNFNSDSHIFFLLRKILKFFINKVIKFDQRYDKSKCKLNLLFAKYMKDFIYIYIYIYVCIYIYIYIYIYICLQSI